MYTEVKLLQPPWGGESPADRMVEEMWAKYRKTLKAPVDGWKEKEEYRCTDTIYALDIVSVSHDGQKVLPCEWQFLGQYT